MKARYGAVGGAIVAAVAIAWAAGCDDSSSSSSSGGFTFEAGTFDAPSFDSAPADAAPSVDAGDAGDAGKLGRGIYVTSQNNAVAVFALGATGDVAPIRRVTGASTQLSLPIGVALDSAGSLYVANRTAGSVTVYAPEATGDVAPTRVLTAAGMGAPEGIALEPSDGVWVAACPSCGASDGGTTGLFHFTAGSTTSNVSVAGASTGLTAPGTIALDETQRPIVGNAFGGSVVTFASGASGDVAPVLTFNPLAGNLQSIAYGNQTIFVAIPGAGVKEFAGGATGTPGSTTLAIGGDFLLQYPGGIAVDTVASPPVLYVADYTASAVYVLQLAGTAPAYTIGSVTKIAGASTTLDHPLGVYVAR